MNVYEIIPDVNRYQSFLFDYPDNHNFWKGEDWVFDCRPKGNGWSPSVYIEHPKRERSNILALGGGLAFDARSTELLRTFLEMSGELLPVHYKGEQFTVLNVTECVDALDDSKTVWTYGKSTGAKIKIERYAFHKHRLPEVPLFKIPATSKSRILTIEGMKDPHDEFKSSVERLGLSGVIFNRIWDTEGGR